MAPPVTRSKDNLLQAPGSATAGGWLCCCLGGGERLSPPPSISVPPRERFRWLPSKTGSSKPPPLMEAVWTGRLARVAMQLQKGAPVEARDEVRAARRERARHKPLADIASRRRPRRLTRRAAYLTHPCGPRTAIPR